MASEPGFRANHEGPVLFHNLEDTQSPNHHFDFAGHDHDETPQNLTRFCHYPIPIEMTQEPSSRLQNHQNEIGFGGNSDLLAPYFMSQYGSAGDHSFGTTDLDSSAIKPSDAVSGRPWYASSPSPSSSALFVTEQESTVEGEGEEDDETQDIEYTFRCARTPARTIQHPRCEKRSTNKRKPYSKKMKHKISVTNKRPPPEEDPENYIIKQLRTEEYMDWQTIAERLNQIRREAGDYDVRHPHTVASVYGRFRRNAPLIALKEGDTNFDPSEWMHMNHDKKRKRPCRSQTLEPTTDLPKATAHLKAIAPSALDSSPADYPSLPDRKPHHAKDIESTFHSSNNLSIHRTAPLDSHQITLLRQLVRETARSLNFWDYVARSWYHQTGEAASAAVMEMNFYATVDQVSQWPSATYPLINGRHQ